MSAMMFVLFKNNPWWVWGQLLRGRDTNEARVTDIDAC